MLFANAILWAAAVVVAGNQQLGGLAVIGLASIGTFLYARRRTG
ncbi:MAG: hypothetical protein V3R29_08545 [Candidatus Acidoferrales bacterium]